MAVMTNAIAVVEKVDLLLSSISGGRLPACRQHLVVHSCDVDREM